MTAPFEEISSLDRVVHEPARLAILTALDACRTADFQFLQSVTGLTNGNLSTHLARLKRAGLVTTAKTFRGNMPHTAVSLTVDGRATIRAHWTRLRELRRAARRWKGTGGREPTA